MKKHIFILFFISILSAECEPGYIEINELCFYENVIEWNGFFIVLIHVYNEFNLLNTM